jgi:D-3-phosphoglycerate dehydrogenase
MNPAPIATAALAGTIRKTLASPVNLVNARLLAEQRGIQVVESTTNSLKPGLINGLELRVESDRVRKVTGTLFAHSDGRIVDIDGIRLEAVPKGHMLLICKIGTVLGLAGVNISRMQLGLAQDGGDALAVVNVDGEVPESALGAIGEVEQVLSVDSVYID